jgi:hypothetical protein
MKFGKKLDVDAMSTDEMWQLHIEIGRLLSLRTGEEVGSASSGERNAALGAGRRRPEHPPGTT